MDCIDSGDFSEVARDHAAKPRNHGILEDYNGHARITGPCGDTMEFWLSSRNGIIDRISFITDGCGSSLACGSMATKLAEGRRIEEAKVADDGHSFVESYSDSPAAIIMYKAVMAIETTISKSLKERQKGG